MHICVWVCSHECIRSSGARGVWEPPIWVLGAELESSGRQNVLLISETAFQSLQSFFDLSLARYSESLVHQNVNVVPLNWEGLKSVSHTSRPVKMGANAVIKEFLSRTPGGSG